MSPYPVSGNDRRGGDPRRIEPKLENGTWPVSDTAVLSRLIPATINNVIYKPVDPADPAVIELADSIRRFGLREPIVITTDNVILSGHRRACAAKLAGLSRVSVRREPIASDDHEFETLLVTYNQQRDKSPTERIREQLVLADPDDSYQALLAHRVEKSRVKVSAITLGERRKRSKISEAKSPFLDAILAILKKFEEYLPFTDRRIHYELLNDPPLIHASKPASRYRNDKASYKRLTDLLTVGRCEGLIPFEAIGDETRPVQSWSVYPNVSRFVAEQVKEFLTGYWRDLMIGQPNHIEIVGEKMTVEGTIRPVAARFTIPYTIGRGYSSLPPRKAMAERFKASGKDKLVIFFLSDHDPEGENIPVSFSHSMRDDFGIKRIHPIRVGLTDAQVKALKISPNADAKKGSSRYKKFVAKFGPGAYELEAVPPETLRQWLRDAITQVIDVAAFNTQVDNERRESATLATNKREAIESLKWLEGGEQ